jgi:uncharacterized protein (UPF0332 family)
MVQHAPNSAIYLTKAQKALAGAELEFAHRLYNNTVNRAYYACYQAAVGALIADGYAPPIENFWSHDYVQVEFPARLIDERHRYPREYRATLKAIFDERLKADYEPEIIRAPAAEEALRLAREFVGIIVARVGSA